MDTSIQQNVIHIPTPCFLFWPGSVKNKGSVLHPQSHPRIQWKSRCNISKICQHLQKGFFLLTTCFHVQHGVWLYQLEKKSMLMTMRKHRRETFTVLKRWSRSVLSPAGWPIVRAAAVNFLSGQTFCLLREQPLVSLALCSWPADTDVRQLETTCKMSLPKLRFLWY